MKNRVRAISSFSAAILLAAILFIGDSCPAQAFRAPAGALAASKKLADGMYSGADNVSFSPFLLDMARIIGRTGLSPGFFLQGDATFPDQPGIDLRTLLLYQAGLLKMPVRLVPLPARAEPRPAPTLTVQSWHVGATPAGTEPSPSLPLISATPVSGNDTGIRVNDRADPSCPLISATPLLREPDLTQSRLEAANSGSPDKISLSNASAESRQPGTAPMISFNLGSFQAQLASSGQDNQGETGTTTPARLLSMSMPRSQAMPFVPRSLFRLWTLRPSDHPLEHNTAVKPGAESAESYKGTFVLSTPGSIKSITGRRFSLASGRLLASNQGGELAFHCDIADISLETDATVILDLSSRGILKIFALESTEHQGTIVETRVEGKIRTFKLTAGEEVLISDHNLSEADFVGSHLSLRNKIDDKFARGNFSVSQVLDKELLLRLRPLTITDEFTSAITQLKRRLAGGR